MQHRESSGGGSGALRLTWSSRIRDRLHEASSLLSRGEKTRRVLIFLSPPPFLWRNTQLAHRRTHAGLWKWGSRSRRTPAQAPTIQYDFLIFFFLEIKKGKRSYTISHCLRPSCSPFFHPLLLILPGSCIWRQRHCGKSVCFAHSVCIGLTLSADPASSIWLLLSFFFLRSLFYSE